MKPNYDKAAGLAEAQHIQSHHEEEMQKFYRQSGVQNLARIHEAGFNRGWEEAMKIAKETYDKRGYERGFKEAEELHRKSF
jgi:hypothetical protein